MKFKIIFIGLIFWTDTAGAAESKLLVNNFTGRSELAENEFLLEGECLTSKSGMYSTCMEFDGNLVTYGAGHQIVYITHTNNSLTQILTPAKAPYRLQIHKSCDLRIYDSHSAILWSSFTSGRGASPAKLVQEDSGALAIYGGDKIVWTSTDDAVPNPELGDTLPNGGIMRPDECLIAKGRYFKACLYNTGELVVIETTAGVIWSTGWGKGTPLYRLTLDWTNNLAIMDRTGYGDTSMIWSTGTGGNGAPGKGTLIMQDNGELAIYADAKKLWSTQNWPPPPPTEPPPTEPPPTEPPPTEPPPTEPPPTEPPPPPPPPKK